MTQNEKDREIMDTALEFVFSMGLEGLELDERIGDAILLANRLLTERENAEVVYKGSGAYPEFWTEDELRVFKKLKKHMQLTKGVWIADGEAE
ncbi:hypothetical protein [Paenilisteria rocourtiae]|uniref:Uncharacterized protein n=1 Tax=Listeria rocourtiae TaxID=647910 RepID=A0A4R6ZHU0_9LIST|nr:hypothetical protein [Listeria rocourtiae]EUJ46697.1 hypothetical protein PROCOU_11298 [Listeria rocourtiae FSL F6-920]TDR51702.1 hypothetical protein DFP96_1118 [Listeria rocourtiae]